MKKIIMGLALGAIAVTGCSSEAAPKDNLASSGTASGAVPSDSATPETLTYAQDGTPNEPAPAETTPAAVDTNVLPTVMTSEWLVAKLVVTPHLPPSDVTVTHARCESFGVGDVASGGFRIGFGWYKCRVTLDNGEESDSRTIINASGEIKVFPGPLGNYDQPSYNSAEDKTPIYTHEADSG